MLHRKVIATTIASVLLDMLWVAQSYNHNASSPDCVNESGRLA